MPSSSDFLLLFERIQQLGGIRLSKQVLKELEETPEKVIFAYPDILKLRVRHRFFFCSFLLHKLVISSAPYLQLVSRGSST